MSKMIRSLTLALVLVTMCTTLSVAQPITLDEFLGTLIQKHPLFEKEALRPLVEAEQQRGLLGRQDWYATSQVGYSHQEPAIAFFGPERTDAFTISGGVETMFWETGGRFAASFEFSRADLKLDPVFGLPDSYYQNTLSVSYTHPLLKNKKGFLDRLEYKLKDYDINSAKLSAKERMEDFLLSSANAFLDWVFLTEQKRIIEERLRLSEEELERTTRKRKSNLVEQADVIRASDAVRIWKQTQMLVASQWNALQAELGILTQDESFGDRVPEFDLYAASDTLSLEAAQEALKANSRLLALLTVRVEQADLARRGLTDAVRPDLSAFALLNTKNADPGFGEALGMDKPDATIGLMLSVPLENRIAKSRVSQADLEIRQLDREIADVTLALTSTLSRLHIQIQQLQPVLQLNQEQIESARERTAEELKLYNQGRGELTFVIQSRDSEQNARLTYAGNALTYHKLVQARRALMDQLFQ